MSRKSETIVYPTKNNLTKDEAKRIKYIDKSEVVVVIDIETTGFNVKLDNIVEIGIVELNLITGHRKILFNSLIHEYNIKNLEDSFIFNTSDLDYEDVLSAPLLESVKDDIQIILNTYKIAAFNINFDFRFLESRGIFIPSKLNDLMSYTRSLLPKGVKYNLQDAYNYLFHSKENEGGKYLKDRNYMEQHRALDDAMYEAELLYFLFRKFRYPTTFQRTISLSGVDIS